MQLLVKSDGAVACLYDEQLNLAALGQLRIERGSHVEPDETSQWWADLAPVGGPVLGPFALRTHALDAEREWLEEEWLTNQCQSKEWIEQRDTMSSRHIRFG